MPIDKDKAAKLLAKRRAKQELAKRATANIIPLASFPPQEAFVNDKSTFIVAQCSRRSGKTNGLALRFFRTMQNHPKSTCLYMAMTLDSAMDIMWGVLKEQNEAHNLQCRFVDSKHMVIHPNGSTLKLYGADMPNFVKRLKGQKSPGIAIDEAQDFGTHLQSLVDDVLTPMMADYSDPWLALTGTPGAIPSGYFHDITMKGKEGYSVHRWTCFENPYMPTAQAFVTALKEKKSWPDDHPTYLREWMNQWIKDEDALWIKWNRERSDYQNLKPGNYDYICGVDIGFRDADAIAVLAHLPGDNTVYLVEEMITKKQDITDLANQLHALNAKYSFPRMIIDAGALGAKIVEELRTRKGLNLLAAEKQRKEENVAFLNDALRTGHMKIKEDSQFVKDSLSVEIDWVKSRPDRTVLKPGFHSDIIDAVLYAFKLSPAYAHAAEPPKAIIGSREWYLKQNENLMEQALAHFQDEESKKNGGWGNGFGEI